VGSRKWGARLKNQYEPSWLKALRFFLQLQNTNKTKKIKIIAALALQSIHILSMFVPSFQSRLLEDASLLCNSWSARQNVSLK